MELVGYNDIVTVSDILKICNLLIPTVPKTLDDAISEHSGSCMPSQVDPVEAGHQVRTKDFVLHDLVGGDKRVMSDNKKATHRFCVTSHDILNAPISVRKLQNNFLQKFLI